MVRRELDHAGLVVDDDNSAGAEHGAGLADLVKVHAEGFDLLILGAAGGRVGFTDAVMVPSDVFASLVDELRPTKRVPQQGTS